jgi:hypothetical protein
MKLNNLFLPILFIGICLFTYSLHVNKITENNLSELQILFSENKITLDEFNDLYEETVSLRTRISNIANGLLTFSVFGFIFCKILKVEQISDFKGIKTLNKLNIFILSNVLWVLFLLGSCYYYYYRLWRGDYSPYKDSIMIEIEISIITYFFWLIPLNLFYLLFLSQTKLPTIIGVKLSKQETIKIKILFLILWMIILFEFLSLISAIWGGDLFSIILSIIYIYILFSIRAGIINKHIN